MVKIKQSLVKLWRFLTSRLFAIILMAMAAIAMAIANIIPQQGRALPQDITLWGKGPALLVKVVRITGLDNLYSSKWFYGIFLVIVASVFYCTSRRIYYEIKDHRHQRGLWPSVLFHASFIVIFFGGLISFHSREAGSIIMTEGETYKGDLYTVNNRDYLYLKETPYFFKPDEKASIMLESFKIRRASDRGIIDYEAKVYAVDSDDDNEKTVRINEPLTLSTGENITLQDYGLAPQFRIIDNKTNSPVAEGYYKLPQTVKTGRQVLFRFPYTDINIRATYYPDVIKKGSVYTTKSQEPKNPALYIRVTDSYGKEHVRGLLRMGETLKGDTISIKLKDMKYWVKFSVVKDQGIPIVYAGFALAAISIVWRLLPFLFRELKTESA